MCPNAPFFVIPPTSKPADFDWVRFNLTLISILSDTKRQIWLTQGWTQSAHKRQGAGTLSYPAPTDRMTRSKPAIPLRYEQRMLITCHDTGICNTWMLSSLPLCAYRSRRLAERARRDLLLRVVEAALFCQAHQVPESSHHMSQSCGIWHVSSGAQAPQRRRHTLSVAWTRSCRAPMYDVKASK